MPDKSITTTDSTTLLAQEQIADAVYTLFLAHGFDGITLQMIADTLHISVVTLAENYPTTYQVWYAALCNATEALFVAVNASIRPDAPLAQLRQACQAALEHSLQYPSAHRFISMPRSEKMQEPDQPAYGVIALRALIKRLVKNCMRDGVFARQSAEMVTQSILCLLHGVTDFQLNIQRIPWVEGLSAHILDTYFAGLTPR